MAPVQHPMTGSIRSWLENIYWGMEHKIVPGLTSLQDAYHDVLTRHVDADTCWLDLGCGTSLLDVRMTFTSAALAIVPPLALLELVWIRALRSSRLQALRPTMIATLSRH